MVNPISTVDVDSKNDQFPQVSKQILVTHATESVHTIGKKIGNLSCDMKQRVFMHFLWRSIIIPNLFTDGAATQQIKTWQGWLAGTIKRKQKWFSVFTWKPFMSEALKKCWAKKLRFLLNTWEKISRSITPDMSASTAATSFTVHHASRVCKCKCKKKTLFKNINSSKTWINK